MRANELTEKMPAKVKSGRAKTKLAKLEIKDVCAAFVNGDSLLKISKRAGVSVASLWNWIEADIDRSLQVKASREVGAHAQADLAEEGLTNAKDPFELAKAKELAHHRRWKASKLMPKMYGEKLDLSVEGRLDFAALVAESRERRERMLGVEIK